LARAAAGMTSEPCLVSVIIPARDAALTIRRAIASVLAQSYTPIEVIVVDDGSRDETAEVVRALAERDVRLIRLQDNRGAAAARNVGIEAASGEIVAFQDADDEWLAGKLEQQMDRLRSDPGLVLVASRALFASEHREELGPLFGGATPPAGPRGWVPLLARNTIATPTVVTPRRALVEAGGFDTSLPVAEDQDMWIRLRLMIRAAPLGFEPLRTIFAKRDAPMSWLKRRLRASPLVSRRHFVTKLRTMTNNHQRSALLHVLSNWAVKSFIAFPRTASH